MKDRHHLPKARYFASSESSTTPQPNGAIAHWRNCVKARTPCHWTRNRPAVRCRSTDPGARGSATRAPRSRRILCRCRSALRQGESARPRACEELGAQFGREMPGPHHAAIATAAAGLQELYEDLAIAAAVHDNSYVRRAATRGLHRCNHPALASTFLMPAADTDWMVRRYAAVGLFREPHEPHGRPTAERSLTTRRDGQHDAHGRGLETDPRARPHRRDMEAGATFAFPACGSSALGDSRMPRLRAVARAGGRECRSG